MDKPILQPFDDVARVRPSLKFIAAALVCLVFFPGCNDNVPAAVTPALVSMHGTTMGTTYSIKYWQANGTTPQQELQPAITELLEQIDRQMSTYREDSELSQFNSSESTDWFPVSSETAFVVERAIHFNQITGGVSDVTVGPLVKLWNFGPGKASKADPPDAEAITKVLESIGCQHLEVRHKSAALKKGIASLEVDLSSIAKGYGVDAMLQLLKSRGIKNAMVEIGGEVRTIGTRLDGTPWRIGIDPPVRRRTNFFKVVPLEDLAMATSGDYRNFQETQERRYTHIIDPRTGQPLEYRGCSVTVLAETCLEADALATALLVMDDQQAYNWCIEHNVAALFLLRTKEGIQERATPRFEAVAPEIQPPTPR